MSTEKSLLMFQDVVYPKIDHGKECDGLYFPVGVSPNDTFEIAHLSHDERLSHVCVLGVPGSGKTKYVEFTLKALHEMYGSDITFFYLDVKGCEWLYWNKQSHMPFKLVCNCSDLSTFECALCDIVDYIDDKSYSEPALVVIDDASNVVNLSSWYVKQLLQRIYTEGPKVNVHVLWASQIYCSKLSDICNEFGLVCATRIREADSKELFGSTIACKDAGVRRYGDVVYSYRGFTSKVRVPFCKS